MLTREEAVAKAVFKGKRIIHRSFKPHEYVIYRDGRFFIREKGGPDRKYTFGCCTCSDNWNIYEKPRPVEMWQWVLRIGDAVPFCTDGFFANKEAVLDFYDGHTIIQRLDCTVITI